MYERHWHLRRPPFRSDVPAEFYFAGRTQQAALLKLRYLVEQRQGLGVVSGPAGSGKTYLLETFREQLDASSGPVVQVYFPQLTAAELLGYITAKLGEGAELVNDEPRLDVVLRQMEAHLARLHQQGRHPLLLIDDAHLIDDPRVWQTLLLLLNGGQADRARLTIILSGPPELLGRLKRFGALQDRLELLCVLQSLDEAETAAYVHHRLHVAGGSRELFDSAALSAVHHWSGGLPRRINRLCDFALLVGYAENRPVITQAEIDAVADELTPLAA